MTKFSPTLALSDFNPEAAEKIGFTDPVDFHAVYNKNVLIVLINSIQRIIKHNVDNALYYNRSFFAPNFKYGSRREPRTATINHRLFTVAINSQIMKRAITETQTIPHSTRQDTRHIVNQNPADKTLPPNYFEPWNRNEENLFSINPHGKSWNEQRERETRPTFVNNVMYIYFSTSPWLSGASNRIALILITVKMKQ